MPARAPVPHANAPWHLAALALLALAIVIAPALVIRDATRALVAAEAEVAHTRHVKAVAYELIFNQRELESATLMRYASADSAFLSDRIARAQAAIPPLVAQLARLTRDNSDQQLRVGEIKSLLEQRGLAVAALLALPAGTVDRRAVDNLIQRSQVRARAEALIAAEEQLLRERTADAQRLRRRAEGLGWAAMAAQLVLLGFLGYVWQRQLGGRLRAEGESTRASARALAVLHTVRDPIVLLDARGQVLMHNPAFAELYGVAEGDARGRPLSEVGDGAWSDPVMLQRLTDVIGRGRELWDYEQPQRTSDGVQRTMLVSARRMELPDSDDTVVLVLASDISARKATEARMQELNRQLEGKVEQVSEVNRELEAFSYSVSHDLRAPLRHVAGFADKLGRHLGDAADERSRHYIEVIGSSARRMSQLIDDLLVYSRLGRGAMQLKAVDMQSLVAETRAMLDATLVGEAPGRRVSWSIAPLPVVAADENLMRTVWTNLLGNAVKYSAQRPEARIEVGYAREEDGTHHFQVRDNGAGFDMQYAGKLFGVFQRMHKASEFPGTGIGLASVRRVLTRHGGRIWAESAPDVGSTFHFTLPAVLDAPSSNA